MRNNSFVTVMMTNRWFSQIRLCAIAVPRRIRPHDSAMVHSAERSLARWMGGHCVVNGGGKAKDTALSLLGLLYTYTWAVDNREQWSAFSPHPRVLRVPNCADSFSAPPEGVGHGRCCCMHGISSMTLRAQKLLTGTQFLTPFNKWANDGM